MIKMNEFRIVEGAISLVGEHRVCYCLGMIKCSEHCCWSAKPLLCSRSDGFATCFCVVENVARWTGLRQLLPSKKIPVADAGTVTQNYLPLQLTCRTPSRATSV